ncbi:hypothetical protein HY624_04090, partial [Candidatus Uhrbacteria bacterium]|nr:hypothetical protein [Candidatus Uhrbacteria bacterium]
LQSQQTNGGSSDAGSQKGLWTGLAALLVLLLAGVGGYFLFAKKDSPANVVKKMFAAMAKVDRMTSSVDLAMKFQVPVANRTQLQQAYPFLQVPPEGGVMEVALQVKASGKADESKEGDEQSEGTTEFNVTMSGVSMKANLTTRAKGDVIYLRLDEVPVILDALGLSSLRGQWIKIDAKEFLKLLTASGKSMVNPEDQYKKSKDLMKAVTKTSVTLLDKHPILVVQDSLPNATLDGVSTYHYKFGIDQVHYRALMKEWFEEVLREQAKATDQSAVATDSAIAEMKKELFPKIDEFSIKGTGELWIGRKDNLLYKVTFTPEDVSVTEEGMTVKIGGSFEFTGKDYGKSFTVEVPSEAMPIEQILGPLFQSLGPAGGF